jgi:hypothetical protein
MSIYQNATPPSSLFSGDVGFQLQQSSCADPGPRFRQRKSCGNRRDSALARRISYIMLTTKSISFASVRVRFLWLRVSVTEVRACEEMDVR